MGRSNTPKKRRWPTRVLLDECVPISLKREFAEFDTRTVRDMRWLTIRNGVLLLKAAEEFDAVITVDVGVANRGIAAAAPLGGMTSTCLAAPAVAASLFARAGIVGHASS